MHELTLQQTCDVNGGGTIAAALTRWYLSTLTGMGNPVVAPRGIVDL